MKSLWLLLIPICLLTVPLTAIGQISVNFQANASVTSAKIVLADIAVIQPPGDEADTIGQLPVAASPAPGTAKEFSTVTVITSLRNRKEVANVDWQGSETIVVQSKGNPISQEQVQEIITDYLQENAAKLPKMEIRFTASKILTNLTVPLGKLDWKVTPSNPAIIGSSSFSIAFAVDGKQAGSCVVRGKLEAITEVATAAVALHKGDLLTEEKIIMERRPLDRPDTSLPTRDQLVGMQMDRNVAAGKIIEQKHIASPVVIKTEDMVKILAHKEGLQISTSGVAKANGRQGETIRVKNISSNRLIYCRVYGPGTVSVEF